MYNTSALWNTLLSDKRHYYEMAVVIGETGRLITKAGEAITFGGNAILIAQSGADSGYRENALISVEVERSLFSENHPGVGSCISSELSVQILRPFGTFPRMALVRPYVRITNGVDTSEWIPQGVYYIDTREHTQNDDGITVLTIHAYDSMLMTEQDFPDTGLTFPATDTDVVNAIASAIGVGVDSRTWEVMTQGYPISLPAGYSMREVLGNIAAMYAGNWIMNYDGNLLLVALNSIPGETNYLIDNAGFAITFGGDRILV